MSAMKEIRTVDAVGQVLCHDITQIVRGVTKNARFRKGHVIQEEDVPVLLSLGKDHIYVWDEDATEMHENEAADVLRELCQNEHMTATAPKEGKIELIADCDGVFQVAEDRFDAVNELEDVTIATLAQNMPVKKGMKLAGMRVTPLFIARDGMPEDAREIISIDALDRRRQCRAARRRSTGRRRPQLSHELRNELLLAPRLLLSRPQFLCLRVQRLRERVQFRQAVIERIRAPVSLPDQRLQAFDMLAETPDDFAAGALEFLLELQCRTLYVFLLFLLSIGQLLAPLKELRQADKGRAHKNQKRHKVRHQNHQTPITSGTAACQASDAQRTAPYCNDTERTAMPRENIVAQRLSRLGTNAKQNQLAEGMAFSFRRHAFPQRTIFSAYFSKRDIEVVSTRRIDGERFLLRLILLFFLPVLPAAVATLPTLPVGILLDLPILGMILRADLCFLPFGIRLLAQRLKILLHGGCLVEVMLHLLGI